MSQKMESGERRTVQGRVFGSLRLNAGPMGKGRATAWSMSGFLSGSYRGVDRLLERVKMVQ